MLSQLGPTIAQFESLTSVPPGVVAVLCIAMLFRTVVLTVIVALAATVALFSKNHRRSTRALAVLEKVDRRLLDMVRRTPQQ
jgi:hypothetical protein